MNLIKITYFLIILTSPFPMSIQSYGDEALESQSAVENGLRYPILIANSENSHMNLLDRMDYYNAPGLSIAVIDNGEILWAKGYGTTTHGAEAYLISPHTLFQAGSISKSITAFGALLLVQQGKISLDENVNDYLRKWKIPDNEFTEKEKVTLRRLLSHSAGTNVHGFPGYSIDETIPSIVEILDGARPVVNTDPVRVTSTPGSELRYSGGGTTIIQLLIEDITGERFDIWMRQNVLLPLGMTESTFSQPLPQSLSFSSAYGHLHDGTKVPGNWHIYPEMAAAGLWSNPTDLAKFILHIQATLKGNSIDLLKSDTVKEMITRQKLNDHQEISSGLGLFIEHDSENLVFQHGGRDEGFLASLYGFAFRNQGVVIMINNDSAFGLIDELTNSVADAYGWPNFIPIEKEEISVDPSLYSQFCGIFAHEDSEIEITCIKNQLFIDFRIDGINKIELHPDSPLTYFMQQGEDRIEFVKPKCGKNSIDELTFISKKERTSYKRKYL